MLKKYNMKTLFEVPETLKENSKYRCKHCEHCQKWECGTKYIFYCGKRKSNRTDNKLLKIKANKETCIIFKKKVD